MGSKYDKPVTITVLPEDWRAARAEEKRQERITDQLNRLFGFEPKYTELKASQKDYSCICVVAQALIREIPSIRDADGASVSNDSCTIKFRNGAQREFQLDDLGRKIIDRFDHRIKKKRAPMPQWLKGGVQVTLVAKEPSPSAFGA